jgi:hypothetical protein
MSMTQTATGPAAGGLKARLVGLVVLAIGGAMCWFFGYLPLQQAEAHAANIEYNPKIFLLGPMLLVCGVMLTLGGRAAASLVFSPPRTRRQHLFIWPFFAFCVAVGGLTWWWFDAKLHALGYVMHY